MLLHHRFERVALALLLIGSVGACDDESNPVVPAGPQEATLPVTISSDRTLHNDTTYLLQGQVTVAEGATLTIEPGTTIHGDVNTPGTYLLIQQGARIDARGTPDAPIVFTSSAPAGQRERGDWGGVVINGRAPCNFGPTCEAEGGAGTYGGNQPDDDSGVLSYVRIEYVGYEVSLDNELNGLTLNGVGRGTQIDHVQVHFGLDDGIEFFGGTVDLKYALVTGAEDDSFDFSTGWQGRGQFWIAQQDPRIADRGFEVDGNEDNFDAEPLTSPLVFNVTLVGKGPQGNTSTSVSPDGMHLRRGYAGRIYNAIVIGFEDGMDVDDNATLGHCEAGEMIVASSIFFENTDLLDSSSDDDTVDEECVEGAEWTGIRQEDPGLNNPYDLASPDFRPAAGSAALTGAASPPNDGFFDAVDFIGGVSPEGSPWYAGWTTTATG